MMHKVMRITDSDDNIYWIDGHDLEEAHASFGDDITVEFFIASPEVK